jgi:hypothetical protein
MLVTARGTSMCGAEGARVAETAPLTLARESDVDAFG